MSESSLIQKTLDSLLKDANDPSSANYFPHIIQKNTDLDPQKTPYVGYSSGGWDLGELTGSAGTQGAVNICTSVQPFDEIYIPASATSLPNINLTDVYLQNLSQAYVQSLKAVGPDGSVIINANLNWGAYRKHGIKGLGVHARFSITQSCCPSTDNQKCSGAAKTVTGTGTVELVVDSADAQASLPITHLSPGILTFGISDVVFTTNYKNMHATVTIEDIPHQQSWQKYAETALNSEGTLEEIIKKLQKQLTNKELQSEIASAVTQTIDGYLKGPPAQYPFKKPSAAIV